MRCESSLKDRLKSIVNKALPDLFGGAEEPHRHSGRGHPSKWPVFSAYAAPIALFVLFLSIVVYAVSTREPGASSGMFPRSGVAFLDGAQLDRKLAGLRERIAANPNDIQALFESGLLKFQKGAGSYVDAISDLETARSKGLADIRTFYYLGTMYQAVGLYDFALEEYRRFLNNRPEDFEVRMLAAKLLFAGGKYALAVKEYEDLNVRNPRDPLVLENLAFSRWKNNQDPKPILDPMKDLGGEAAFRSDYISGRMAYESKDYAEAARLLELTAAARARYPGFTDSAEVYRMLGDSYVKLRSDDKAISALGELLVISPADNEARSLMARLSKARKKTAQKKK